MKKRKKEKRSASKNGALTSAIVGAIASLCLLAALLMTFSIIGLASENPHSLLSPFSFFSIYAASFLGGFICIRKNKGHDALLCGSICGMLVAILFSVIFLIFGLIFDASSTPISWIFRGFIIVASIIGALLSSISKSKVPKRKRRK